MQKKALAMLEYTAIAQGMRVAGYISKACPVTIIKAYTLCPSKYVILFSGRLGGVREALDGAKKHFSVKLASTFVLGNPSPSVLKAVATSIKPVAGTASLGVIETKTASSAILAADAAAKSAKVTLNGICTGKQLCSRAYFVMTGTTAEVGEAAEHAKKAAAYDFIDAAIINNPQQDFLDSIFINV